MFIIFVDTDSNSSPVEYIFDEKDLTTQELGLIQKFKCIKEALDTCSEDEDDENGELESLRFEIHQLSQTKGKKFDIIHYY